jgi:hypothetical protein
MNMIALTRLDAFGIMTRPKFDIQCDPSQYIPTPSLPLPSACGAGRGKKLGKIASFRAIARKLAILPLYLPPLFAGEGRGGG